MFRAREVSIRFSERPFLKEVMKEDTHHPPGPPPTFTYISHTTYTKQKETTHIRNNMGAGVGRPELDSQPRHFSAGKKKKSTLGSIHISP